MDKHSLEELKKVVKGFSSHECSGFLYLSNDHYFSDCDSLHVDVLTCLTLRVLYDDPNNENFNCPWEWRTIQ